MDDENKPFSGYRWAIITFLLVTMPFLFFTFNSYTNLKNKQREEFQSLNREAIEIFSSELTHYLSILDGIKTLFVASTNVEIHEWDSYLNAIIEYDEFSAVKSIAFLPQVKSSELNKFLETARRTINPDYQVTPSGKRDVYFPVYYLTTFQKTVQVYGKDHYSIPECRNAIDEAIKTKKTQATEKLILSDSTTGVIIYLPIYKKIYSNTKRENGVLIGLIACSLAPEYFFPPLLKGTKSEDFIIEVYDGKITSAENLLLSTKSDNYLSDGKAHKPEYEMSYNEKFAGRDYTIKFYSTPVFEAKVSNLFPLILGITGIITGILSGGIVGLQIRSRKQAHELLGVIKKSNDELRQANEQLKNQINEKTELLKEVEFEKNLFDELLENIPDAVYFKDKDSRFLRCSKYALYKIGLPLEKIIGKTDFDLFTDEHARDAFEDEQQIIKTGKPIIGKVEREVWKDGKITYALTTKMPYRDKDGNIIGTLGISKDITEIRQVQNKLAEEKEILALTLNSIGDAVISTDELGRVILINPIAEQLTGWKANDAVGKPLREVFVIVNEQTRQPVEDPVEKVIKNGKTTGLANNTVLIAKDKTERIIADSAAPIKDSNGKTIGVVLVFRDVTDKYRYEEERIKVARLETIERFAGGLSHDFNNILTAIIGNISLVKMMLDQSNQAYTLLESAERSCVRAKNLTRQLLTFTKSGSPVTKPIQIASVLRQAVEMAAYGKNINLNYLIPNNLPLIEGDDSQLQQAFIHLATFSVQTIPPNGIIFIGAEQVVLNKNNCGTLEPGDYVKIIIQDHGEGVPPERIARFFEPYYAHTGPGSGVGLAAAESIIRRHKGRIDIHSIVEKGTTFTVYLPVSKKQPEKPPITFSTLPELRGKRLLVMDDEENICTLVKAILERYGLQVETSPNGEDAIKKFIAAKRSGVPFDLVILDLTIQSGVGGKDVVVELKKHDPNVKAVVSSGYSFDPIMSNYKDYGFVGVIQKPYSADELRNVITELLIQDEKN